MENLRRTKQFAFANAISHFTSYKLHHHSPENAPDTIHWPLPRLYRWRRRAWNFMIYESAPICPSTLSTFPHISWPSVSPRLGFLRLQAEIVAFFPPKCRSFRSEGLWPFDKWVFHFFQCGIMTIVPEPISHILCPSIRQVASKLMPHRKWLKISRWLSTAKLKYHNKVQNFEIILPHFGKFIYDTDMVQSSFLWELELEHFQLLRGTIFFSSLAIECEEKRINFMTEWLRVGMEFLKWFGLQWAPHTHP